MIRLLPLWFLGFACIGLLGVSGVQRSSAQEAPAANDADKPALVAEWVDIDPATLSQERAWTPPHTKGNLWGNGFALLGPNLEYDPLWNLRWGSDGPYWKDNDFWRIRDGQAIPLTRDAALTKQTPYEWRVRHSVFPQYVTLSGGDILYYGNYMEFRREKSVVDGVPTAGRPFTAVYAGWFGDTQTEVCREKNLADSGFMRSTLNDSSTSLVLRDFPLAGAQATVSTWSRAGSGQWEPHSARPLVQDSPESSTDSGTLVMSRMATVMKRDDAAYGNAFVLAKALNARNTAYEGDLTLRVEQPEKVFTLQKIRAVALAVETSLVPLFKLGSDIVVVEETQQGRRIGILKSNQTWETFPVTPALKGIFVGGRNTDLMALIGDEVFRLDTQARQFQRRVANPIRIPNALGIPFFTPSEDWDSTFIVLRDGPKDPKQPVGDGFDFAIWDSTTFTEIATRDSLRKSRRPASWIADNCTMAKDMIALKHRGFDNTVLIYQSNIYLKEEEAKGFKNKNGTVIEFFQPNGGGDKDRIRLENDFGGDWLISTWDGTQQFEADDKSASMSKTRGKGDKLVNQQREARQLLLLDDIRDAGEGALIYLGEQEVMPPWESDHTKKLRAYIYSRWYSDGRTVRYWFDADGKDHDLICVQMRFAVGDDVSENTLWFSDFTLLPDLTKRNPGRGIRMPGRVRAYHPTTRELRFEMNLLNSIKRKSFDEGDTEIKSGYNWGELDEDDFSKNYDLAD